LHSSLTVTFERASAMLERLADRVERSARAHEERPGLAGLKLLLEVLVANVADTRRRIGGYYEGRDQQGEGYARKLISDETKRQNSVAGACLTLLERAPGRDFDPFVGPIGRLARQVAGDTELIVNSITSPVEYQITEELNDKLFDPSLAGRVGTAVKELASALPKLVVLRYPANEEADSFSHLLLGHELAHLALRKDGRGDRIAGQAFSQVLEETKARNVPGPRREMLPARSQRWFTELACDRLGLRMIGPAFYLALYEYATLREWEYSPSGAGRRESDYNQYPALAWRLTKLGEFAEGYLPKTRASPWPAIRAVFGELKEAIPPWEDPAAAEEREIVAAGLRELSARESDLLPPTGTTRAVAAVDTKLKRLVAQDSCYSEQRFREDMPLVWRKLDKQMLPAERIVSRDKPGSGGAACWQKGKTWSVPVDWRSIINGTYLHWWANKATLDRDVASKTARGAVELSEIHLQALTLRDELRVLALNLETGDG
jgi:hypothetical protein